MSIFLTVVAVASVLYAYAEHCHTRAHCRVCDYILNAEEWPVSTPSIHKATGVSVARVFTVLDELESKGLVHGISVPAGHRNGRAIRLIYLGKKHMGEVQ